MTSAWYQSGTVLRDLSRHYSAVKFAPVRRNSFLLSSHTQIPNRFLKPKSTNRTRSFFSYSSCYILRHILYHFLSLSFIVFYCVCPTHCCFLPATTIAVQGSMVTTFFSSVHFYLNTYCSVSTRIWLCFCRLYLHMVLVLSFLACISCSGATIRFFCCGYGCLSFRFVSGVPYVVVNHFSSCYVVKP